MAASDSAGSGLRAVLIATAIAELSAMPSQLLAPALLTDEAAYVAFSVFWSTLYLGVSAMSGVQQEVTRAAHPAAHEPPNAVLRTFTLAAGPRRASRSLSVGARAVASSPAMPS